MISAVEVPFDAKKLTRAKVVLRNESFAFSNDDLLDKFGYIVEQKNGHHISTREVKEFLAERYGGAGLLSNGGGARCGNAHGFQVKGIGRNLLAGDGVDFWYSHGSMSLAEALKEFVWGELLSASLPWGSNRVIGVIQTGTTCWTRSENGRKRAPRALVVRESSLRPGHYERATYFRPTMEAAKTIGPDAHRVRDAIATLHSQLPPSRLGASDHDGEILSLGLIEMTFRFAEQLGTARAKRIMHGGLSSSNICLDGRWIDYGSVSLLPTYANTRNVKPGFWSDDTSIKAVLQNILFYVSKYGSTEQKERLISFEELNKFFYERLAEVMAQEFVLACGLPGKALDGCWKENTKLINDFAITLLRLCRLGRDGDHWGGANTLSAHGDFAMPQIMSSLLDRYRNVAIDPPHYQDISELVSIFGKIYEACARSAQYDGVSAEAFERLVTISQKLNNKQRPDLFEPNMTKSFQRNFDKKEWGVDECVDFCRSLLRDNLPGLLRSPEYSCLINLAGAPVFYEASSNGFVGSDYTHVIPWNSNTLFELSGVEIAE